MAYPSLEQYNEALQAPQLHLLDPELKTGTVRKTGLGLPMALCGGFALTYTINAGGKKYALRCFHKEAPELERRYQAISTRLKQLGSHYFLRFDFMPRGIRIQGKEYPIVKMEWASGETLSEFLEREHRNPAALNRLRATLAKLAAYLEQENIAHGDIQPGNLMVSQGGGLVQLIDYDGMFVESLRGSKATELGQLNFQHPKRSPSDFNERLDRFSFLALDVALQTLAIDAGIWGRSQSDPDAVVFRRSDYQSPGSSNVFREALKLPQLKVAVQNLAQVAAGSMGQVPSLSDFTQQHGIPQINVSFIAPTNMVRAAYQGPYDVVDATNYQDALALVGDKVELIGRIVSVVNGETRNHTDYIFVNFTDWRGLAVKLNIWSDGLAALGSEMPTTNWVGRWITISGLLEPPFSKRTKTYSYTHISISVTQRGQIQIINESEAMFRLGKAVQKNVDHRNAHVVRNMGGTTRPSTPAPTLANQGSRQQPAPSKTGNQSVLESMRKQTARQPAPVHSQPYIPTSIPSRPTKKRIGPIRWVLLILGILFLLYFFGK
ncbi:MAG TPA: protein kinase family protein [Dyella sp.]|uniref:protein kinase family protein n=1 Tax=Dyella sp. TaxID=1869338 RepID=UPI002C0FA5B1|nr:protein kinase family protein [Dyella sp.]HTV84361.1 protein kinase family protein [Dyella sp.]